MHIGLEDLLLGLPVVFAQFSESDNLAQYLGVEAVAFCLRENVGAVVAKLLDLLVDGLDPLNQRFQLSVVSGLCHVMLPLLLVMTQTQHLLEYCAGLSPAAP